jgi:hypothetical protein
MSSVQSATRIVLIVGARPTETAGGLLRDASPEDDALVLVLGRSPSALQLRLVADALDLADGIHLPITAELVSSPTELRERLRSDDRIRVAAARRDRRRWRLREGAVTPRGAR